MKKKLKVFLFLCSRVNLSKHGIYALFGRLKQFLKLFYYSRFDAPFSVILWNSSSMHFSTLTSLHGGKHAQVLASVMVSSLHF